MNLGNKPKPNFFIPATPDENAPEEEGKSNLEKDGNLSFGIDGGNDLPSDAKVNNN